MLKFTTKAPSTKDLDFELLFLGYKPTTKEQYLQLKKKNSLNEKISLFFEIVQFLSLIVLYFSTLFLLAILFTPLGNSNNPNTINNCITILLISFFLMFTSRFIGKKLRAKTEKNFSIESPITDFNYYRKFDLSIDDLFSEINLESYQKVDFASKKVSSLKIKIEEILKTQPYLTFFDYYQLRIDVYIKKNKKEFSAYKAKKSKLILDTLMS